MPFPFRSPLLSQHFLARADFFASAAITSYGASEFTHSAFRPAGAGERYDKVDAIGV
jgi:hypothetical protein